MAADDENLGPIDVQWKTTGGGDAEVWKKCPLSYSVGPPFNNWQDNGQVFVFIKRRTVGLAIEKELIIPLESKPIKFRIY